MKSCKWRGLKINARNLKKKKERKKLVFTRLTIGFEMNNFRPEEHPNNALISSYLRLNSGISL